MESIKGLDAEDRNKLRAPFASSAVGWLPVAGIVGGKQRFLPHVNASLVFERLSEVDPAWTLDRVVAEAATPDDPLGAKHGYPHRAFITVHGVTRSGRGVAGRTEPLKSAESDAIKRAALAFEVGAYLRAFDAVFLPQNVNGQETFKTKPDGKFSYLTAHGKVQLAGHYERVLADARFKERYGDPVEYGDVAALEGDTLADQEAASAAGETPETSDAELEVLLTLAKFNGRDTPEDVVRDTLTQYPFVKCLARILNSVKANLLLDAEAAEGIRVLAQAASEEDADALRELGDRLVAAQKAASEGDDQQVLA